MGFREDLLSVSRCIKFRGVTEAAGRILPTEKVSYKGSGKEEKYVG